MPTTILITGSSGYIGTQLCQAFQKNPAIQEVIGVDRVPPKNPLSKLTFYQRDCTTPLSDIFSAHSIDMVIHLIFFVDMIHDTAQMFLVNVGSLENILRHTHRFKIQRILITSSVAAYGAHPDNQIPLREDSPLRGNLDFPYSYDKTIAERRMALYQKEHPETELIIARPTIVVGPHLSNYVARFLSRRIIPLVKGCTTEMQFIHESDLTDALALLTLEGKRGAYNLAPPDSISAEEIAQMQNRWIVRLPGDLLKRITEWAWRLHLKQITDTPGALIDFFRYPWRVDGSKITQETSFSYRYSSRDAVDAFLRGSPMV